MAPSFHAQSNARPAIAQSPLTRRSRFLIAHSPSVLAAMLTASALAGQAPSAVSTIEGGRSVAPSPNAVGGWVTPWDVFLGCRGIEAIISADSTVLMVESNKLMHDFCALGLPKIGVRFTE